MREKVLLAIPLIALLLSGCIQSTGEEKPAAFSGGGIVITEFSSSRDEVSGQDKTVRLYLSIENRGTTEVESKNLLMCLIGPLGKSTKEQMWVLSEGDQCVHPSRSLRPYDPSTDSPGGSARASWKLKSPYIPYGMERNDEFTARVYYLYTSSTSAKITVYSESEVEAMKKKGVEPKSIEEVSKTYGPVDIDILVPSVIRAEDGSFTLKLTVRNVGGGVVFNPDGFSWDSKTPPSIDLEKLNALKIEFVTPSDLEVDCESEIELGKGETRTISCDVEIKEPEKITTKKTFPITVKATYGYYIDGKLSIKVVGEK